MPIPSKIKMVTMTVGYNLNRFINLKVLHGIILDNDVVGIKCDNKIRGIIKTKPVKHNKKTKDFKNQCTLIISAKWNENRTSACASACASAIAEPSISNAISSDIESSPCSIKMINAKLFNNGKIIFTGCTDIEQIKFALQIITNKLYCLYSPCDYDADIKHHTFNTSFISDVIKKEVIFNKEYVKLILEFMMLTNEISEINIADLCHSDFYNIYKMLYSRLYSLKAYYPVEAVKGIQVIPEFMYSILSKKLCAIYPSYSTNSEKITIDYANINILNINSRMSCGFSIKKNVIYDLLKEDPNIKNIYYDENIYPGIKAQYQTNTTDLKKMEIIFFNSGKINITSTQTFAQIQEIYEFIISFCKKHYTKICIERDDVVQLNKHNASLPNQYIIESDGDIYVLLKKTHLLSNSRNAYIMSKYVL